MVDKEFQRKDYKKQVLKNLCLGWFVLLIAIGLIVLEAHLTGLWVRFTNGLWLLSSIALVFFTVRGLYYLRKYIGLQERATKRR